MKATSIRLSALLGSAIFAITACSSGGSSVPAAPGGTESQPISGTMQQQSAIQSAPASVADVSAAQFPLRAMAYEEPADPRVTSAMTAGASVPSVTQWTSSFTFNGTAFPFFMVGTNPFTTNVTTTIPTEIQPINFHFADGTIINAEGAATALTQSPIFQNTVFPTGTGQFDDIFQRANFAKVIGPGYHVRLGAPTMLPAVTIDVPMGTATIVHIMLKNGTTFKIALVNINLVENVVHGLVDNGTFNPRALAMMVAGNVYEFIGKPSNCCVLGFHNARLVGNGVQTYAFGAWPRAGIFGNGMGGSAQIQDMTVFSHETGEWLDDPNGGNVVPAWGFPQTPATCFSNILEVGDVIEGFGVPTFHVSLNGKTYHPQDLAFYSWFAHQVPSIGINGQYSYESPAKLTAPPPPCK